ncbi:MAG: hypothetical protein K6U74_13305 [Firmicutes bacterium]|nr:hypothetical protein [Bacillota bacterium]
MGRKKREKKKKRHQAGKSIGAAPENTAGNPVRPDLGHLSGDWREFYRLVIDRISSRQ